jgi:phenylalanyl-tRNA synthetase beta chain
VLSQGMVCLDGELGMIATATGLHVFHDETLLGASLSDVLDIEDALVHVKVPPNRPDCLGLIGIAREVAATLGLDLVLPRVALPLAAAGPCLPVEIADPALCARYTCQVISNVTIAKSPPWLSSRLVSIGSRAINNVVDITNFVLYEWGHPLHAFDFNRVRGGIVVRQFGSSESLQLLDGRTVASDREALVIADSTAPLALAGIMGGRGSEVTADTTSVLLEAAHFDRAGIRRTSRRLGLTTDASYRFERGMDQNETLDAARERAASLLLSVAQGTGLGPVVDEHPCKLRPTVFALTTERVNGYLGTALTEDRIADGLRKLGYGCDRELKSIQVPTRRVDATDPVVLIEDVARVIGYDSIPVSPSAELPTSACSTVLDAARRSIRELLAGAGCLEVRGVPLEPDADTVSFATTEAIALTNPLTSDLARLRRSLMPSLLGTAGQNARRRAVSFRYFEIDKIFSRVGEALQEQWSVAVLLGGEQNDFDWSTQRQVDLYDLKGIVESILELMGTLRPSFLPAALDGYAPGTGARIYAGDSPLGVIGQIVSPVLAPLKIHQAVYAAEINLDRLLPERASTIVFAPLPRFPAVFRDLSFVVRKSIPYEAIEKAMQAVAGPYLESIKCIDVFEGKGIPAESRSVAVSLVFRAQDRTLSSEEVTASVDGAVAEIAANFRAELRNRPVATS